MNHIDAIFYINLETRPDRNMHFLNEIQKLTSDMSKVHRYNAIYHTNGVIGCTTSHIAALEEFINHPEWSTCLIFEDDFTFRSPDPSFNNQALNTFFTSFPSFDCCNLASSKHGLSYYDTYVQPIKKAKTVQTASGYCVSKAFAPILLKNFKESKEKLEETEINDLYAHDQFWKRLQPESNWYLFYPPLGYQYGNFSDINQKFEDYNC
jgi:GR25 family glycosyltransferase involved in LPS biosynthesis